MFPFFQRGATKYLASQGGVDSRREEPLKHHLTEKYVEISAKMRKHVLSFLLQCYPGVKLSCFPKEPRGEGGWGGGVALFLHEMVRREQEP